MNAFKLPLVLTLLSALAACGGGGSTAPAPGGGAPVSFAIHVDTGAGGTDLISARLSGVFLESADGSGTANLLPAPAEVVLVHPSGESAGIAVTRVPAGVYVAAHLLVEGAVALARRADGTSTPVVLPGADLRVTISGGFATGSTGALLIGHSGSPSLLPGAGGGLAWSPALTARQTDNVTVTGSSARVVAVDLARRRVTAELPSFQGLAFDLEVDGQSRLVGDDGGRRGVDDFLRECASGSELSFAGFRQEDRALRCLSVHHHGRGGEDGYVGRIASLDANSRTFELDVQARKVRGSFGPSQFSRLVIDASSAVIYHSHRSTRVAATFADLAVGSLVEVEGSTPSNGVMVARGVGIEDQVSGGGGGGGGGGTPGEVEGRVMAIDIGAGTLEIGPRGNDPLIIGGVSVSSAVVSTDASTAIYRKESSGMRAIQLVDVTATDRIWIVGAVTGPQSVHAAWIRVEADR